MIKHVVMWNLKNRDDGEKVKSKLESMAGNIPQIKRMEVGLDAGTGSSTHEVILITYHDTVKELNEYQDHEYHQEIKKFIPEYCKDRVTIDFLEQGQK